MVFRDEDYVSRLRGLCRSARSMIVGVGSLHMQVYCVDCFEKKCACIVSALREDVYLIQVA